MERIGVAGLDCCWADRWLWMLRFTLQTQERKWVDGGSPVAAPMPKSVPP